MQGLFYGVVLSKGKVVGAAGRTWGVRQLKATSKPAPLTPKGAAPRVNSLTHLDSLLHPASPLKVCATRPRKKMRERSVCPPVSGE